MAVKLNIGVTLSVSSSCTDEKDLGNVKVSQSTQSTNEGGSRKFKLAAGVTDQAIDLGNITTVRFIFIKTQPVNENDVGQAITIKRNGIGGEAIQIKPFTSGKVGLFMLTTDSLTSLYATNSGTIDVEITLALAGD